MSERVAYTFASTPAGAVTARAFDDAGTAHAAATATLTPKAGTTYIVTRTELGLDADDAGHAVFYDGASAVAAVPFDAQVPSLAELTAYLDTNSKLAAILIDTDQTLPALLAAVSSASGTGDTAVDHDLNSSDSLRYVDPSGNGIDQAEVRAYLKSEWDADPQTAAVRGRTTTGTDGRWIGQMLLDSGTYVFTFKADGYAVVTQEETVQ